LRYLNYWSAFSPGYIAARRKFRAAALSLGLHHTAYPINQVSPTGEQLTIDVACSNTLTSNRTVVISSGLHGVEGFLGSAIQLGCLDRLRHVSSLSGIKLVFIHALNPYGFAWLRRWNEDSIDLNRNFLLSGEVFEGSPRDYPQFNSFLNPTSPPSRFEAYTLKALWLIFRYGMTSLRNTLPVGQYDFPKGLFFGGHASSKTQEILSQYLPAWIGNSSDVIHIDFHTGLGRSGTYKLLLAPTTTPESYARLSHRFGSLNLEYFSSAGMAYPIRGGLAAWSQALLPQCRYDLLTAEFGTYPSIQVLKALRAENRSYWWGEESQRYGWTTNQLLEMFAPKSQRWRQQCFAQGLSIFRQALNEA
jgi:hypothetical protein